MQRKNWSRDSCQLSAVWCGRPAIKSKLILANPAARSSVHGAEDVFAAVHASCGYQFAIIEGLRAQADAIDARGKPGRRFLGRVDGFRIGFEGHFAIRRRNAGAVRRAFGPDRRIEQAGRAAAEIDRVDRLVCGANCAWQACCGIEGTVFRDFTLNCVGHRARSMLRAATPVWKLQ